MLILLLQETWTSVLHHVCGEHIWSDGECKHGPLTETEPKTPLDRNSKAMTALREIVLDRKFIPSLVYCQISVSALVPEKFIQLYNSSLYFLENKSSHCITFCCGGNSA